MPFDLPYLLECSDTTLKDIALSRMDRATNLRKAIREMLDELADELLFEQVCRFAVENRAWLAAKKAQRPLPMDEIFMPPPPKKLPTSVRTRREQSGKTPSQLGRSRRKQVAAS